jgi:hypothetical protein
MQNNETNIDNSFRHTFADFEVAPPPQVWERIENSLDQKRKRRIGFFVIGLSTAASLLFAFIMGWQFLSKRLESTTNYADSTPLKIENKAEGQTSQASAATVVQSKNLLAKRETIVLATTQNSEKPTSIFLNKEDHTVVLDVVKPIDYIASQLTIVSTTNRISDALTLKNNTEEEFLSASDRAILEANLLAMNLEKESDKNTAEKGNWSVGVQGSPVYRFDQSSQSNPSVSDYVLSQNSVNTTYNTNLSGGVKVEYTTKSKLSFQTGVNYSSIAMDGGEVGVSMGGYTWNQGLQSSEKIYMTNDLGSLVNAESLSTDNQAVMNSTSGLANLSFDQGASLASMKTVSSIATESTKNYEYKQEAQYVEIPFLLRYNLIENRFGMHLLGGINSSLLINNLVRLVNNNDVVARGKIEDLRPLTFSSSFGFGLNYDLTDKLQLSLEPTLKVQLNSLNSSSIYNLRPYTVGVFSGIAYRF